jgi:anti-sigma factor RsiW
MSHLGDLLSAHIDGELDGAERDKVSVHLARCERCRAEAAGLRALKRQIGDLATTKVPGEADMLARLLEIAEVTAIAGPAGPVGHEASARRYRVLTRATRRLGVPARLTRPSSPTGPGAGPSSPTGPTGPGGPRRLKLSRRHRYVVLGAMSIVMSLGTAAFSVGGSDSAPPGPKIVPQYELYSEEQAINSGEFPIGEPGSAMVPALTMAASKASPTARQP